MTPILASNYGNVFLLVYGVPVVVISCALGVVAMALRFRPLAISCGVVAFLVAACLFLSLRVARDEEFVVTVSLAVFSLLAGIGLMFLRRSSKE